MSRKILEEINAFESIKSHLRFNKFYCNYCGEQLRNDDNYFIDLLGFTFCNRDCFRKVKRLRQPKINFLQKQFDINSPRVQIYDDSYKYQHLR